MKKIVKQPQKEQSLQAIINYLVDNGLADFDANQFIHVNLPALGEYKNIVDCVREGKWDEAWSVTELYVAGDLW